MPASRHFLFSGTQAWVFHVCSRIAGRAYFLSDEVARDAFVEIVQNYERFCGVEVRT